MKTRTDNNFKVCENIWIHNIPSTWSIKKLKYVANVRSSNVDKKMNEDEIPIYLCNYVDVFNNDFIDNSFDFMEATATEEEIEKFTVKKDDVIITKDSETPSEIAIPAYIKEELQNTICGYHLAHIKSNKKYLLGSYLFRLFQAKDFNSYFETSANGITRFGLSLSSIKDAYILLPTLSEQQSIAAFLDYKTKQIDDLIEKKEQLLKLLEEKRIALITQAVIKGLNPNVKMKSSGIDWLGDIPEHWDVKRLRFVAKIQFSGVNKKTEDDETDILLCNYIDVYKNEFIDNNIDFMKATAMQREIEKFTIKIGDVLVTKDSETPDDIAVPSLVIEELSNVICGYHLAQIRVNERFLLPEYLFRLFQAKNFNVHFTIRANGVTRFGVGTDVFGNSVIPIIPKEEQNLIVDYIKNNCNNINRIKTNITKAIYKLKEYRIALITAAVTGKIDVRDFKSEYVL